METPVSLKSLQTNTADINDSDFTAVPLTVVGELVMQDHSAVSQRAAVSERHLDAVVDLGSRHVSGEGKHVDSQDMSLILVPVRRRSHIVSLPNNKLNAAQKT